MLEVSQYLISNYITKQEQEIQHGTGKITDMKNSETE
jgi:hypothetical protein